MISNILPTIYNRLKDYQKEGVAFMINSLTTQMKGCIQADDMGLGKTLQLLCVIIHCLNNNEMKKEEKILIIVPKSVVQVWKQQASEFASEALSLYFFTGNEEEYLLTDTQVILTTYNLVKTNEIFLKKHNYYLIILDEAHIIKNKGTKLSKIIKSLNSSKKIAATGTPMENKVTDFISLFDFICKDYLNEFNKIKNDAYDDNLITKLRNKIAPHIIRREKHNVLTLPSITYKTIMCSLTKTQHKLIKKENIQPVDTHYREYLLENGLIGLGQAWLLMKHPTAFTKKYKTAKSTMSNKMVALFNLETKIRRNEKIIADFPEEMQFSIQKAIDYIDDK